MTIGTPKSWPQGKKKRVPVSIGEIIQFSIICIWFHLFIFTEKPQADQYNAQTNCLIVVQLLSHVHLFATPWTATHKASLSFTTSWSLLKLMFIESVMPSNRLILCRPLPLLPSVFPSIRVFSNGSALHIRSPKYWSWSWIFSSSISPSNEYSGLISFRID